MRRRLLRQWMPKLRRAHPIRSVRRRRSLGNDDSAWCRRLMNPSFRAGCLSLVCCPCTVFGSSSTRLVIHKLPLHAVHFNCSLSSSFDILPDLRGRAAVAVDDDDEDDQCQASPPSRANNQPWQTCIAQSHWNCRRVPNETQIKRSVRSVIAKQDSLLLACACVHFVCLSDCA